MARCAKCNKTGFRWQYNYSAGRNQLFDPQTGDYHTKVCKFNKVEYDEIKQARYHTKACRHGILLDSWCDQCEYERQNGRE